MNSFDTPLRNISPAANKALRQAVQARVLEKLRTAPSAPQVSIDDPLAWITSEFYVPELNGPIQLAPYQEAVLREAYRTDAEGLYVYSIVIWSDVKKSLKSCIAAAVALERARRLDWGSVKVVANDLKQADSRVAFYARRAVELNPRLKDVVKVKPSGYRMDFPNRAVIEAIPIDPKGEAGGNDDLIIFSELWGANQRAAMQMWTEMTLSPTKYGHSQRWVESYAGRSGEAPLLEQLYETGVKEARQLDLGMPGLEVYANDAARMLCLWNTIPYRLPWLTPDYYAQEEAVLIPSEFRRVHRNSWESSEQKFVPDEWWDACAGDTSVADGKLVVMAMDAAISNDCFAIAGVSRIGETTYTRFVRIWRPAKGQQLDFSIMENEVYDLLQRFRVAQISYDKYQLHDMATRIRRKGVVWVKVFEQGQDRLQADKQLYDNIRDRNIIHGSDPGLTEHVRNANAAPDADKLRIVKRADHLKIDACVALSMANAEARRLNVE